LIQLAVNIKALIIDDHPLFRDALELALIKSDITPSNIRCESTIENGIKALNTENYGLLLLDLNLSAVNQTIPIIIISATETEQAYNTAMTLGASGYIPKSSALEDITAAIKSVLSGQTVFPEKVSDLSAASNSASQRLGSLTPAQHRVMNCLSDGLLNKQIAFEMSISEATVKAHMTAIFRKLGANNLGMQHSLLTYEFTLQLAELRSLVKIALYLQDWRAYLKP